MYVFQPRNKHMLLFYGIKQWREKLCTGYHYFNLSASPSNKQYLNLILHYISNIFYNYIRTEKSNIFRQSPKYCYNLLKLKIENKKILGSVKRVACDCFRIMLLLLFPIYIIILECLERRRGGVGNHSLIIHIIWHCVFLLSTTLSCKINILYSPRTRRNFKLFVLAN